MSYTNLFDQVQYLAEEIQKSDIPPYAAPNAGQALTVNATGTDIQWSAVAGLLNESDTITLMGNYVKTRFFDPQTDLEVLNTNSLSLRSTADGYGIYMRGYDLINPRPNFAFNQNSGIVQYATDTYDYTGNNCSSFLKANTLNFSVTDRITGVATLTSLGYNVGVNIWSIKRNDNSFLSYQQGNLTLGYLNDIVSTVSDLNIGINPSAFAVGLTSLKLGTGFGNQVNIRSIYYNYWDATSASAINKAMISFQPGYVIFGSPADGSSNVPDTSPLIGFTTDVTGKPQISLIYNNSGAGTPYVKAPFITFSDTETLNPTIYIGSTIKPFTLSLIKLSAYIPPPMTEGEEPLGRPLGGPLGFITIVGDMNYVDANNVAQTNVSASGIVCPSLSIGNSQQTVYTFPSTYGVSGQVLGIQNGILTWVNGGSGPTNLSAGLNIDAGELASGVVATSQQVQFESVIVENLAGPSNQIECNAEMTYVATVNPLSSVQTIIDNDSVVVTDPETVTTNRKTATLAKDSVTFGVATNGTAVTKSYMDATEIVVPSVKVGQYGGVIAYELPVTAPGPNQILESNNAGNLQWGTFSASGIQSITTTTPSALQISTTSGICTINYVGTSSGITAGTNLTLTSGVMSLNDTLNFTLNGGINFGNPLELGSSYDDTGINIRDENGNLMNITSDVVQITNNGQTFASVGVNGVFAQSYKLISSAGISLYQLPTTAPSQAGQVLSSSSGLQCQWVTPSGGQSYSGSQNITINAQNEILLNAIIDLGSGASLQTDLLLFQNAQDSSRLTVSTSTLKLADSAELNYYSLSPTGCILNGVQILSADRSAVAYTLPAVNGSAGNCLGYNPQGQLTWITPAGSAFQAGANIQIVNDIISLTDVISLSDGNEICSIAKNTFAQTANGVIVSQISNTGASFQGLSVMSGNNLIYSLPKTAGVQGQVLSYNGAQALQWIDVNLAGIPNIISLSPNTLTAEYNQAENAYKVGFLGYTVGTNISVVNGTISTTDALVLSTSGSLSIGSDTVTTVISNQEINMNSPNSDLVISAGGIELTLNATENVIASLTTNGVAAIGIKMMNASENILYSLPQTQPNLGDTLVANVGGLAWAPSNVVAGSLTFNINPTIANQSIYQWDGTTLALTRIELSYNGIQNGMTVNFTNQMFLNGNTDTKISHSLTNVPMAYWPKDLDAQAALNLYRIVGEYKCSLGTAEEIPFSNLIAVTGGAEYLSQNPSIYCSFSRNSITDTTFTMLVDLYYPNIVYDVVANVQLYGWQQPSGYNGYGGGNQTFVLFSNLANSNEQKFTY